MNFYKKYKIRVVYDCGYVHEMWVWSFKFSQGTYTWSACSPKNNVVILGADHIVCVYTVAVKKAFKLNDPTI